MKRALFALIAVAATGALLAPLVATAKKNDANPDLSIAADPDVQIWPRQVTISGKLHGADHAGKTIELEENTYPLTTGGFKTVGTTTTDAQGDYSFKVMPQEHTLYRAMTNGIQPPEVSQAMTTSLGVTERSAASSWRASRRRVVPGWSKAWWIGRSGRFS